MAYKWLCQLDVHYPHLSKRAREFNQRDDFVMKYDPEEVTRREQQEQEKKRSKKEQERSRSKLDSGSSNRDDYHRRHSQSSSNRSYRDSKRGRFERVVSP